MTVRAYVDAGWDSTLVSVTVLTLWLPVSDLTSGGHCAADR